MPIERKRVVFDLVGNELKPRFVDGQELPNWKDGPTMIDYIKQLASDHWTLTGSISGQEYLFERQAP